MSLMPLFASSLVIFAEKCFGVKWESMSLISFSYTGVKSETTQIQLTLDKEKG